MKVQCSCGTKVAFDVTPDMAQNPVRFVCPNCGLDSSELVNRLILQEISESVPIESVPPPAQATALPPVRVVSTSALAVTPGQERVHVGDKASATHSAGAAPRFCPKHPRQRPTHKCLVCQKPMCPKCMEYFGFVCSALCKNKAELQGIDVPVYAGQKSVVESRKWKKINRIGGVIAICAIGLVVGAFWFHFFASRPSVVFSIKFDQPIHTGQSVLVAGDQLIYLCDGILARHDVKEKKRIWSLNLVDSRESAEAASTYLRNAKVAQEKYAAESEDGETLPLPSREKLTTSIQLASASDLSLHVNGQNIWVSSSDKLVRYDWSNGGQAQEISIDDSYGRVMTRGDELWITSGGYGAAETLTRVNLATGETHTDQTRAPSIAQTQVAAAKPLTAATGKGLDPAKIAAKAPSMSFPQKLALPATLSIQRNQQAALDEMDSQDQDLSTTTATGTPQKYSETLRVIPTRDGTIQFSAILLERRIVARKAMKDAPAKPALNGDVSVVNTLEVANEILNDMQRQRGEFVEVDESRYLVTIRRPDVREAPDWREEVVGPPELFPLKTVTVLAAGNNITVLDKLNKKLWQSTLNYPLPERFGSPATDEPSVGQGPCVEHGNVLYVFDEGVLAAFDLVTGNANWRLPSVGISALFFDEEDNVYVNSTTADPESIKYSRQIDVTSKVQPVVMKIDSKSGKILWSTEPGGGISYLSGKFIYTLDSFTPDEDDGPYGVTTGFETPPFIRIKRINPKNGKIMWEHFQQLGPLDVHFDKNTFEIVFKKEVQVLKFFSL